MVNVSDSLRATTHKRKFTTKTQSEVAKMFQDAGISRLHLVDLDGAKAQHDVNYIVLENYFENRLNN